MSTLSPQQFINYSSGFPVPSLFLVVGTMGCHDSLYSPVSLSSLRGQEFALCPLLSYRPRKSCWFSVCSAFYLFLGWNGNLQTLHMQNWKVEIAVDFLDVSTGFIFSRIQCYVIRFIISWSLNVVLSSMDMYMSSKSETRLLIKDNRTRTIIEFQQSIEWIEPLWKRLWQYLFILKMSRSFYLLILLVN